jgi:hypothetical protein
MKLITLLLFPPKAQYVFIHTALDELNTCGDTEIAAANIRIAIGKLNRTVQPNNVTGFSAQFQVNGRLTFMGRQTCCSLVLEISKYHNWLF